MDDQKRLEVLENALAQMLKPVRGIPFYVIVKALAEQRVTKFDKESPTDARLLALLEQSIHHCAEELKANPIRRPRPNEVGNDIEPYVLRAIKRSGLQPSKPTSRDGLGKATGYPDLLFYDAERRPTYLECKIFAEGTAATTMRSFYLSPSESFKVSLDARHLLLAFGMEGAAVSGSRDSVYTPRSFRLVDLHDLLCDVKYEFNSDNRRLYAPNILLLQGKV
jgi:hypothetical protein